MDLTARLAESLCQLVGAEESSSGIETADSGR